MLALESLLDALHSISATLAIVIAAWGFGRMGLRWLQLRDSDALSDFVWSQTLGLVIGAAGLLFLALLGALHVYTAAVLTLAGVLWAALEGACIVAGSREREAVAPANGNSPVDSRVGRNSIIAAAVFAGTVLSIGTFAALAPPASHQVLASSLDAPKNFLLNHGFRGHASPQEVPNLARMWSLWALALAGPVAANLLHTYLAALLAAAVVLLARPLLGPTDAWLAGCLTLLSPGLQQQLGMPLESVPLALVISLAAQRALQVSWQCDMGPPAVAAGLMLGAAIAIDPSGMWLAIALVASTGIALRLGPIERGQAASLCLQVSFVAALVALPWVLFRAHAAATPGVLRGADLLALLGPVLLIALGGLGFARRLHGLNRLTTWLLVYAAFAICLPLGPVAWAPLLPLACVAAAWGWCEIQRVPTLARISVAGLAVTLATCDAVAMFTACQPRLAVACGWQPREAYLRSNSGSYRAAALLNQMAHDGERLLSQDAETLYFSCPTTLASQSADVVEVSALRAQSRRLIVQARREGYAYLLLKEPVAYAPQRPAAQVDSMLAATYPDPASGENLDSNAEVIPILEYCFADDNNRCIRYRLLKLQGPQAELARVAPVAEATRADADGQLPRLPTR